MESFYLDRPLNFAHQGASHEAPGNTLAAFLLAIELGADGIELDVHLSKDGEVVVIHDFTLEGATDGEGLVRDKTLAELKDLDAGIWFDPAFSGERIPTLQEVFDAVGDRLLLNIELKTKAIRDDELVPAVVRLIEENHLLERVVVSSFNPWAVWSVKRLNPWIPVGQLSAPDGPLLLRRSWLQRLMRLEAIHPHYTLVDSEYVRRARKRGCRVNVWTADDPGEMWQLMRMGVDLIITNRPDLLRQVLLVGRGRWRSPTDRLLASSHSEER